MTTMEAPAEPVLKQLQPPTVSLRLESADLGLNLALLFSAPSTKSAGFSSGCVALQKLLPALRSVGICNGAYDAAKEAELERFETSMQHQSNLRREQHEFYSKVEKRFASMTETTQRMKRDYYREIDHLREQLSRKRKDPNFEPDTSVVFFDPDSYRLPSWMEIVEELDGMRMKRELLQQEMGADRVRTVPLHMLCAGCRGKFQSPGEMPIVQHQNSCDKEIQVGGSEDDYGECSEPENQTDVFAVDKQLAGAGKAGRRVRTIATQYELDQSTGVQNSHGVSAKAGEQDNQQRLPANHAHTGSVAGDAPKSSPSATLTAAEQSNRNSVGTGLPTETGSGQANASGLFGVEAGMAAEVIGDINAQRLETVVPPDGEDVLGREYDGQSDCSDSLARSHSSLGGSLDEANLALESLDVEPVGPDEYNINHSSLDHSQGPEFSEESRPMHTQLEGSHVESTKDAMEGDSERHKGANRGLAESSKDARRGRAGSNSDAKRGRAERSKDGKGGDSDSSDDAKTGDSKGNQQARGGDAGSNNPDQRALVMQAKLEQVFSEDAAEARRRRVNSRSRQRARSSVPSHQIPKRKQLAAARLARQLEAIQKHLQRLAFARLRGPGPGSIAPVEKQEAPPQHQQRATTPHARPVPRTPAKGLDFGLLGTPAVAQQLAAPTESPQRVTGKHPQGYALNSPGMTKSASVTEFFDSPTSKLLGQKRRSRSVTRFGPAALDADMSDSPPHRSPSPAFSNQTRSWTPKTPPWTSQNPGGASICSFDGIGAIKAQSTKSFAAAIRLSSDGLLHKSPHQSSVRPRSATGIGGDAGLPFLARGVHCRRAP